MKTHNLDTFREQFGADKLFYNEMIGVFIKSLKDGLEAMDRAAQEHNTDSLRYYIHKIISPCRHIEAAGLVSLLKKMEDTAVRASDNDWPAITSQLEDVQTEASTLIGELETEYL